LLPDGSEADRAHSRRPWTRRDVFLVVAGHVAVEGLVGVVGEDHGAVAGLAGIAVPAADRGGVSRSEGDAGARPGEAAVGGARDEDAAGVAGAIEVEVSIVDDALAIEDDRRVASTVDVIVAVVRSRERPDVAVPAPPQIGGGVEPGAAPAEAVIVRAADDVARVGRIDGDARLVLGEAAVVEVQTDVVPLAAQPLDRVLV